MAELAVSKRRLRLCELPFLPRVTRCRSTPHLDRQVIRQVIRQVPPSCAQSSLSRRRLAIHSSRPTREPTSTRQTCGDTKAHPGLLDSWPTSTPSHCSLGRDALQRLHHGSQCCSRHGRHRRPGVHMRPVGRSHAAAQVAYARGRED